MSQFLADENVPRAAVEAARKEGFDVAWVHELAPSVADPVVLTLAEQQNRTLVTFDKDFGELAFRLRRVADGGIILLRPRLKSPDYLARFLVAVLKLTVAWERRFSVAREGRLRSVPFPP